MALVAPTPAKRSSRAKPTPTLRPRARRCLTRHGTLIDLLGAGGCLRRDSLREDTAEIGLAAVAHSAERVDRHQTREAFRVVDDKVHGQVAAPGAAHDAGSVDSQCRGAQSRHSCAVPRRRVPGRWTVTSHLVGNESPDTRSGAQVRAWRCNRRAQGPRGATEAAGPTPSARRGSTHPRRPHRAQHQSS